jgi:colanic acid/amylovoran biosynthesis glycosyltransferase
MKVLLFNKAFFFLSETFIYQQVTGMPDDVSIDLLGFTYENEELFPLNNKKIRIKWAENSFDRIWMFCLKYIFSMRTGLGVFSRIKLKKILKEVQPDLIHTHFGFNAVLIYPIARKLNIPMVVTYHGVDASPEYMNIKSYREITHDMFAFLRGIIIVSPHMKETLSLSSWSDKTYVIPCGVNPQEFDAPVRAITRNTIHLLHSGRLVSKKGVSDLIKVFIRLNKKYDHIRLHIIGDGLEMNLCRQLANEAPEGYIKLHGAKSHEEVKKMMQNADVFILNSRQSETGDMEGVPVSILEAMSMRLPVVSTRHAGIPYVITHELDGLLVNEKDNDMLSDAIERLVIDADLRKRIGEAARITVENRFTTTAVNNAIANVYRAAAQHP